MKTLYSAALAAVLAVGFIGGPAQAQEDKKTARLWKAKCSSCHGAQGKADTAKAKEMKVADMSEAKWQAAKKDADIKKVVLETQTVDVGGKKEEVHGFQGELDDAQLDAMVALIRSFKQ
jgi:mono/diheme cytochrome c family protein